MISEKAANTVNTVRTIDTNLSDHRAKVYDLSFAPKKSKNIEKNPGKSERRENHANCSLKNAR